jgi:hypothetical protein
MGKLPLCMFWVEIIVCLLLVTGRPKLAKRQTFNKILPCNDNCFEPQTDLFTSFSIWKSFLFRT